MRGTSRAIVSADHQDVRHLSLMSPTTIDGVLTSAAGVYVSLITFGVISPGKDKTKVATWRAKWGAFLKIAGPVTVAYGVYDIIRGL